MKLPPRPKTKYEFDNEQDKRIFEKLAKFENKELSKNDEELVKFLYSQLETDWRTPLEQFVDKLYKK